MQVPINYHTKFHGIYLVFLYQNVHVYHHMYENVLVLT